MNANRYRLIFNRARGLFMAVAEIASACGKTSGETRAGSSPQTAATVHFASLRPAAAFTTLATLLALGAQLTIVPLAQAQIVAYKAAPANQQPTVLTAGAAKQIPLGGNGVPLVNIQTPSAAGVSRNTYSQFDVDANGVILNNARNNALTQLGGWVQGNPWLARGSARVILNEVVSAKPSQLLGYVEVAGSSAQVVIANPAGIACDGCGFINTSRATLTTGTPMVNGGNLDGYRVEGGTIRIDGAGLDASRSAYTDLIARAVEVNAGLWAQTLKVSTGTNIVAADHSSATPISASGPAPAFAIDVASLGGMYAGKITLVGTEAGVGVRNAGHLGASAGEVIVTVDGHLTNSGSVIAAGAANVDARAGIVNSGTVYAQGDLGFATVGDIINSGGLIAAQGNATLSTSGASSLITGDAAAVFAAGLNADGSLASTGLLNLTASEQVSAHGQQVAGGDLAISARRLDLAGSTNSAQNIALTASADDLDLSRASSIAEGTLTAHTAQTLRHDDARSNAGQLDLAAHDLTNARGELVQTGSGDAAIALAGNLDNSSGRIAVNSLNLSLAAQTLTNTDGSIEHAGTGTLAIVADTLAGTRGQIVSNGTLALTASTATLDAGNTLANTLNIVADSLSNQGGLINQNGNGEARITVSSRFDNRGGTLSSNGGATLAADALDNRGGQIQSTGDLAVRATDRLDNSGGLLRAGETLDLGATTLINANTQGVDQGVEGKALTLLAAHIDNRNGALRADTALTVTSSGSLDNSGGLIASAQSVVIGDVAVTKTLAITNSAGTLLAGQLLAIDSASLSGDGSLLSQGDLTVRLVADYIHAGAFAEFTADGRASFETAGTLSNAARMRAGTSLLLTAATIDNQASGEIVAPELSLVATDTNTLTNRGLIDGGDTRLDAVTLNNLGSGRIYGDHLSISATTLNNLAEGSSAPVIAARDRLDLAVGSASASPWGTLNNHDGALIFSAGDMAIGGALDGARRASGTAGTVNNISARIEALGDLAIRADTLNNQRRTLTVERNYVGSQTAYSLRCEDPPDCDYISHITDQTNTYQDVVTSTSPAASILAGGNFALTATNLSNQYSSIEAGGNLDLSGSTLTNLGAELYLQSDLVRSSTLIHWGNRNHGTTITASSSSTLTGSVPAIISADGELSGDFSGLIDNVTIRQHTAPVAAPSGTTILTLDTGSGAPAHISEVSAAVGNGASGPGAIVRTVTPGSALPGSSLFSTNPDAGQPLVETDPRFAGYRNWLTSDYMLTQLSIDPATTQKRLGDGFYEQRLINEQVGQLTGRRFLAGFQNEEAQYQALMDAGVVFAKAWNLVPGIALSAEQMAQLTSDIVWLVEKQVTLADGSTQQVLVPQVYARLQAGDLAPSGALLAGDSVKLKSGADLVNGGRIAGRQLVSLDAVNIRNLGGEVSGKAIVAAAQNDLQMLGGSFSAQDRLRVSAGRDLSVASSTVDLNYRSAIANGSVQRTDIDRVAGLYVSAAGGTLLASAGRDLALNGAVVQNQAADGTTQLAAGRDLTLGTVTERRDAATSSKKNHWSETTSSEGGSRIETGGDLTLMAGNDLAVKAAYVQSGGAIDAQAGHDLTIDAGQASYASSYFHRGSSGGLLSKKTTTTNNSTQRTSALASTLSGDSVVLVAGNDLQVKGSNVVASNDATLLAGRGLSIESATETHNETHFSKTKQSGVFSSGGVGFTIGSNQNSTDQKTDATLAAKSTIGSLEGNVTLLAGETYKQVGSDVIAVQGDIDIAAKQVDIVEARETSRTVTTTKAKQSGLTVAITSPVISAVQTVQQMSQAAKDTKDPRMQLLAAANVGMTGYNAYSAIQAGQGITTPDGKTNQVPSGQTNPDGSAITRDANAADQVGGINLSISIGGSKSSSKRTQTSDTAAASNLTAGRDISITASGAGEQSDILLQGAQATATRNLSLTAEDEIRLLAAVNTAGQKSSNKNSSASVGFSVGTDGLLFNVGASGGRGKADGKDLTWTNTQIEAGNKQTLDSGGNTTLRGATAKGDLVIAKVGGDLSIESLQDTSTYDSKQQSLGGSISVGYGKMSGSVSASGSKVNSNFASVSEQSSIRAGDGGFQVAVKGDTDLKGGAITSTQQAINDSKNSFQTDGELTLSDIQNKAEYSAKSASVNIGTSLSFDGALKPGGTSAGIGKDGGNASSTTLAAISGVAGNTAARTGDAETGIAKIFNADKVQKEIEAQVKITQMFGQLASKAVGDYAQTKTNEATALREQAKNEPDDARASHLKAQAQEIENQWGETGTLRLAAHTVIGGLTGGVSGAAGAAAGTLTAPLVADALAKANIDGPLATALTGLASTAAGAVVGGTAGASTALNEVANNYLSHPENTLRAAAKEKLKNCEDDTCKQEAQAEVDKWNAEDLQRDLNLRLACDGASGSAPCADETRKMFDHLETFAADSALAKTKLIEEQDLTLAHKDELQSYLDLIKVSNPEVKTSAEDKVRDPSKYNSDAYGVIDREKVDNTYLVMKFGNNALTIANTYVDGEYWFTPFTFRNGQSNDPGYAPGLGLTHVDAAALTKHDAENKGNGTPYVPIDRFVLSYAPTNGGLLDTAGTTVSKMGIDSAPVVALRNQFTAIQAGGQDVYWIGHSRGGEDIAQAASGASGFLDMNKVVFHAGANTSFMTDPILLEKRIDKFNGGYRDSPNDLVPQYVGLRALTSPLNFIYALIASPCIFFCSAENSPHTLPYDWPNLLKE